VKENIFGYDRYRIPCKYLPYNWIDLGLNRLVTLPPRLYKAGRDPLESNTQSIQNNKAHDVGFYVTLTAWTCINLMSCVFVNIWFLIMRTPTNHLLPWVYPSIDYQLDFIDTSQSPCLLPMVSLYQGLAFPVKEKGKSFHYKVSSDMPTMRKHAQVYLNSFKWE